MTVLILTCEGDVTTDMVVTELHGRGVPLVRLDPADLPGRAVLSAEYAHGDFAGHLSVDGFLVSMSGLRSVWVRSAGAARRPCAGALAVAHRGGPPGAVRHAVLGLGALDEPSARRRTGPPQALAAAGRPRRMGSPCRPPSSRRFPAWPGSSRRSTGTWW